MVQSRGSIIRDVSPGILSVEVDATTRRVAINFNPSLVRSPFPIYIDEADALALSKALAVLLAVRESSVSAGQGAARETLIDGDGAIWYRLECGNYAMRKHDECTLDRHKDKGCFGYTRDCIEQEWGIEGE